MPAPLHLPRYVYKIIPEEPKEPLPCVLPLSELDERSGFCHLSTAEQTPATAARFFSKNDTLWVLKIPLFYIEKNVKWEEADGHEYPHLYTEMFGREEVDEVKRFEKNENEDWTVIMEQDPFYSQAFHG